MPVILCNELRREKSLTSLLSDTNDKQINGLNAEINGFSIDEIKAKLIYSLDVRGFDSICLFGATDGDIIDFASKMTPKLTNRLTTASLRNASVSDKALEVFLATLSDSLIKLELSG